MKILWTFFFFLFFCPGRLTRLISPRLYGLPFSALKTRDREAGALYCNCQKKKKKKDDLLITCLSSCLDQIWIEMYYGTSADSTIEQKTKITKSPKHMKGKSN